MSSQIILNLYGRVSVWRKLGVGSIPDLFGGAVISQRLPTDSIGTFSLTLTNLVVGSAIRIEIASTGTLVEFRTVTSTTETFSIPAYSPGSDFNSIRIKVRKGSAAPLYKPFDTLATAIVGTQSVYIAQIPD